MDEMAGTIGYEVADGVARITFTNPEKRNAMSLDMWTDLARIAGEAAADPAVRVLLLQGAGDAAFVSGSDVSGFKDSRSTADATRSYNATVEAALAALAACPKPAIAAIRGYCIGGGVSIAATADLRISHTESSFAIPAARLGVGYSRQQIERLQQLIGPARLRELIFTGRRTTAREALAMGLVNQVLTAEEYDGSITALATQIATAAPLTLRAAKRASQQALLAAAARDDAATDALIDACFASEDYREGQAAFAEKRKPNFQGR
jgi:enoyl-CoA hydratase/carnithine racemase